MEDGDNPAWYSLIHALIILAAIGLMSVLNSYVEHRRPKKLYVERDYRYKPESEKPLDKNTSDAANKDKSDSLSTTNRQEKNVEIKEKPISDNAERETDKKITDEHYFSKLMKNYESAVVQKLERPEARHDIVVRYYVKPKDGKKVFALRKYGFYIHQRPSDKVFSQSETNTLYYGDEVRNEDIQLVAYILMNEGVMLKQIVRSSLHDDWKSNSIEIGTDSLVSSLPTLGLGDLRKKWQ